MSEQEKNKKKSVSRDARLERLRKIFGERTDELIVTANDLIKEGLNKRKAETETQYFQRIQYCEDQGIKLCYVGFTYNVDGTVNEYVKLKEIMFRNSYPNYEIKVKLSTPEKCQIVGRATPDDNWIPVEYTLEKAKALNYYKETSVHWKYNPAKMLNKCCKGDFYDLASGRTNVFNFPEEDDEEDGGNV